MGSIVISGIGLVCPFGAGSDPLTEPLWTHQDRPSEHWRCECGYVAALPTEPPIADFAAPAHVRKMDRLARLSVVAAGLGLRDARLFPVPEPENTGSIMSTSVGALATSAEFLQQIADLGYGMASPMRFANTVGNAALGHVALAHQLKGFSTVLSGSSGLTEAVDLLRSEKVSTVCLVAGDHLPPVYVEGLRQAGRLTAEPPAPLGRNRSGFGLGQAVVALVLERSATVRGRGCTPYCSVAAHAMVRDPGAGVALSTSSVDGRPFLRVMTEALRTAGLAATDLDALFAASNGSRDLDLAEGRALAQLCARKASPFHLLAPKALFGETFAASEPLSIAIAALSLRRQMLPASLVITEADPDTFLLPTRRAAERDLKAVLVNGAHQGGVYGSTVLVREVGDHGGI